MATAGLRRDPDDQPLGAFGEDIRLRVTEEQAADDLPGARVDRHREIAAHRQVTLRHAVMRRHRSVARIFRTSSMRIGASPRNVGPNSGVARGWPNFSNASLGAPDSV